MDKYFMVKHGCEFEKEYWDFKKKYPFMVSAFKERFTIIKKRFGIETDDFYISKEYLKIVPTDKDIKKFQKSMLKYSSGTFKGSSAENKAWVEMVKDLEIIRKPAIIYHIPIPGGKISESKIDLDGVIYCHLRTDKNFQIPDFGTEISFDTYEKVYRILKRRGECKDVVAE